MYRPSSSNSPVVYKPPVGHLDITCWPFATFDDACLPIHLSFEQKDYQVARGTWVQVCPPSAVLKSSVFAVSGVIMTIVEEVDPPGHAHLQELRWRLHYVQTRQPLNNGELMYSPTVTYMAQGLTKAAKRIVNCFNSYYFDIQRISLLNFCQKRGIVSNLCLLTSRSSCCLVC